MDSTDDRSAVPTANEADAREQQVPAVPGAQDEAGIQDAMRTHGDPLRPEGSEADRLDQNADGGGANADDEEYPRGAAGEE